MENPMEMHNQSQKSTLAPIGTTGDKVSPIFYEWVTAHQQ